ncbi:MAG: radical SAM protein [Sandaracinaceae bacterium]
MTKEAEWASESSPSNPHVHRVATPRGPMLFVVDGSRVYDIDAETDRTLARAIEDGRVEVVLDELSVARLNAIDDAVPEMPVRAISLAIAQKCNLACTYCYAQQGHFGGPERAMSLDTARRAVDALIAESAPGDRVQVSFLGGEPLVNRAAVRQATEHAVRRGAERGVEVGFAITTNGTLLDAEDGAFFEEHGFAVTVSMDGPPEVHNRLRPTRGGRGTHTRIMRRVAPLLAMQRRMQVSARVTVTPFNLCLVDTLDHLLEVGFHSVGFSPMLASPSGAGELDAEQLGRMLEQMVQCGRRAVHAMRGGERYAFSNLVNALREIHRGTHRPYPCGAGAGYVGVSATGQVSACHRFVDDASGDLGHVDDGLALPRRRAWLAERHVHQQRPCDECWARYLCGGGCHHEVIHRGRPACDYIRGWLHFCLTAYAELLAAAPEWFGHPDR